MAKLTINEMILKTISTKLNKEPKYKEILETMGYTVYDSTWSGYNNWTVRNEKTNREIVFSRGYDGRKRLYDGSRNIKTYDFKKVDYAGYLNCKRKPYNPYSSTEENKYSKLRYGLKHTKEMIQMDNRCIESIQNKINKLTDRLNREMECRNERFKHLEKIRKEIKELKK